MTEITPNEQFVINGITRMMAHALSNGGTLSEAMNTVESRLRDCLCRATEQELEQRSLKEALTTPPKLPCACGSSMLELSGRNRKRTLELSCGPVRYGRAYYASTDKPKSCACPGRFPMDEALRLPRGALDLGIVEKLTLLSVMLPYEQAVTMTQRLLKITVSKKRAVTTVSRVAKNAFEQLTERVQLRWSSREQLLASRPAYEQRRGRLFVMADGTCVGIKQSESFKECKSAVLFWEHDLKPRRKRPNSSQRTRRRRPDRHLKRKHIVSYIGPHDEFMPYLWDAFVEVGGLEAQQVIWIADGAEWIWNDGMTLLPDEHFEVCELLDWYHLFENLWKAARVLFKNPGEQRRWIDELKGQQRRRNTGRGLAAELRRCLLKPMTVESRESVEKVLDYVETNSDRMRYADFRELNWPRGSAAIESVNHGVIQARFKLPGMRWTVNGANWMLCLRNAYFSGRWDDVFAAAGRPLLHEPCDIHDEARPVAKTS